MTYTQSTARVNPPELFQRDARLRLSEYSYRILDRMIAAGFPGQEVLHVAGALAVEDASAELAHAQYDRDQLSDGELQ